VTRAPLVSVGADGRRNAPQRGRFRADGTRESGQAPQGTRESDDDA
jgi:hypothetical protein